MNHGDSYHSDNMRYEDMKEDILYFLKEKEFDQAIIMGHSLVLLSFF